MEDETKIKWKENRVKSKSMVLRVTEEDFNKIKEKVKKSKLSQNDYLAYSALNKKIVVQEGLDDLVEQTKNLALETKRIGVNLNQLTRLANSGSFIRREDLEEINRELVEVWQLLRQLIQKQV